MGKYFAAVPTTYYANTLCKDILRLTQFGPTALRNIKEYYQFQVLDGIRPDLISSRYYNNPYYDWIVYHANQIVDPYYDWPLTDEALMKMIEEKYGSISYAQEKVLYYAVNWSTDDRSITPSAYNQLSEKIKQYWRPDGDYVSSYVRKELDWKVSTNQTVKVYVDTPSVFTNGNYINQVGGGIVQASGEVVFVGDEFLLVEKVEGTFTTGSTVQSFSTDVSTTVSTVDAPHEVLHYSIPLNEQAYWRKFTAYEYEEQLNDEKRTISLVDSNYVGRIQRDLEEKMTNE